MKSEFVEILFGWLMTPIIHLNLMQIFIAGAEFIIICWTVSTIYSKVDKYKDKRMNGGKTNERKDNKDRRY